MALPVGQRRTAEALLLDCALEALLHTEFNATPATENQALTMRIAGAAPLV